ncbi:hypothetical protein FACS189444_4320 [Spirochaetia bacterium]|nr:hypothetical protein FACS189444_4320 [Spirochaetia bacterium]
MNITQSAEFRVTGEWYKKIGTIALWYAGIFAAVIIIMSALLFFLSSRSENNIESGNLSVYTTVEYNGFNPDGMGLNPEVTIPFMLIMGIVLPLTYREPFIALGVTRTQLSRGTLAAVLLLSVSLALFQAPIYLITTLFGNGIQTFTGSLIALWSNSITFMVDFMVGWIIVHGFGNRRFHIGILGIVVYIVCTDLIGALKGEDSQIERFLFPVMGIPQIEAPLPETALAAIVTVSAAVLVWIIMKLTEKTPVRC